MPTDIGINHRETLGLVSDGPNEVAWLGEPYPTTKVVGGVSVTAGWEDAIGGARDRSGTTDRRLAGIGFTTAAGVRFRMDLPAGGAWDVHCATGDGNGAGLAGSFDFVDGTTVLASVTTPTPTGVDDATNVNRSVADWPTQEAALSVTTTPGNPFRVVSRDAATNCLAHVRVVQSGGGGTTVSGSGAAVGSASGVSAGTLLAAAAGRVVGGGSAASVGTLRLTGSGLSPGVAAVVGSPRIVSTGVGTASGRGLGAGVLPGGVTVAASGCSLGRGSAATLGLIRATAQGVSPGRAAGTGGGLLAVAAGGVAVSISVAAGVVPGPLGPGKRAGVWVVPGPARTWIVPAGGRTWEVPTP